MRVNKASTIGRMNSISKSEFRRTTSKYPYARDIVMATRENFIYKDLDN